MLHRVPDFHSHISIHAPAKGATLWMVFVTFGLSRFQSTLPRRERHNADESSDGVIDDFNPRSREGSDIICRVDNAALIEFQSTLPRRERPVSIGIGINIKSFQSTLPRRERRRGRNPSNPSDNFNPRSREGSDHSREGRV